MFKPIIIKTIAANKNREDQLTMGFLHLNRGREDSRKIFLEGSTTWRDVKIVYLER